jgi:hypothetical protein
MRILVIGGMHGNEPLGINLVKLINKKPINNITAILANEKAVLKNKRFIKKDLNRSFPGNKNSKDYELKRAHELLKLCKEFNLVFDFHNTDSENNNCSFVGNKAKQFLFNISSYIGLNKVVSADYDCINKYALNCISIEISVKDKLSNPNYWYKKIKNLSKISKLPEAKNIQKYKFVYRITLTDKKKFNLKKSDFTIFKPISKSVAKKLKVKTPAYPIFISDKFTPYNFGGLLNKVK